MIFFFVFFFFSSRRRHTRFKCDWSSDVCSSDLSETGWSRESIRGLPDIGVANVWSLDVRTEESNGDLLASAQDPLTPPSLFLVRPAAAPELLKRAPEAFDPAGLVVSRHEATSPDGTRVPYVPDRP